MTKNVEKVSVEKKSKFVDHLQFIQVQKKPLSYPKTQLNLDPIGILYESETQEEKLPLRYGRA
jgi:hypothetical protein